MTRRTLPRKVKIKALESNSNRKLIDTPPPTRQENREKADRELTPLPVYICSSLVHPPKRLLLVPTPLLGSNRVVEKGSHTEYGSGSHHHQKVLSKSEPVSVQSKLYPPCGRMTLLQVKV